MGVCFSSGDQSGCLLLSTSRKRLRRLDISSRQQRNCGLPTSRAATSGTPGSATSKLMMSAMPEQRTRVRPADATLLDIKVLEQTSDCPLLTVARGPRRPARCKLSATSSDFRGGRGRYGSPLPFFVRTSRPTRCTSPRVVVAVAGRLPPFVSLLSRDSRRHPRGQFRRRVCRQCLAQGW